MTYGAGFQKKKEAGLPPQAPGHRPQEEWLQVQLRQLGEGQLLPTVSRRKIRQRDRKGEERQQGNKISLTSLTAASASGVAVSSIEIGGSEGAISVEVDMLRS